MSITCTARSACARGNKGGKIEDVTQSIMQQMFCMIMLVNLEKCDQPMDEVRRRLDNVAAEMQMELHLTREEVFDAMHHI